MNPRIASLLSRAVDLHQKGNHAEAVTLYSQILELDPTHFDALRLIGLAEHQQGRNPEAAASIEAALRERPDSAEALSNYAIVLESMGRQAEAIAKFEQALQISPTDVQTLYNFANSLKTLKRYGDALANYDKALALRPGFAAALYNRGNLLKDLGRPREALASYDLALAVDPAYVKALFNKAAILIELKRYADALGCVEQVRRLNPEHPYVLGQELGIALDTCDWARVGQLKSDLEREVRRGTQIVHPFLLVRYSEDSALQLACAERYLRNSVPARPAVRHDAPRPRDKTRLAYMSADFRRHPVAYLTAELFELHDRARFDVFGISLGRDDGSDIRARIAGSFDRFCDAYACNDNDAEALVRHLGVDILVDLTGHTNDARPAILAGRPAPIQVNYLGYPGTMGADFTDYILADPIVLPFDEQRFYTERIVHLPDSFQPNDSKRPIAAYTPARQEVGLPPTGFVFCCFNASYKLTAPVFDIWMRLLNAVKDSVLWLSYSNEMVASTLRREAGNRGVDPARIIFAPKLERLEDHLARQRLADLFLDTLPYNAHTSASDALWAALPVLTCLGTTFPGRVGASLLHAVGLPELIVTNLADYETQALRLATHPLALRDLSKRLEMNRLTYPLFDSKRLCRHLESAYTRMWELWQQGQPAQSFAVVPNGSEHVVNVPAAAPSPRIGC